MIIKVHCNITCQSVECQYVYVHKDWTVASTAIKKANTMLHIIYIQQQQVICCFVEHQLYLFQPKVCILIPVLRCMSNSKAIYNWGYFYLINQAT